MSRLRIATLFYFIAMLFMVYGIDQLQGHAAASIVASIFFLFAAISFVVGGITENER